MSDGPVLRPSRAPLAISAGLVLAALLLWRSLPVPGQAPRGYRTMLHEVRLCTPQSSPSAEAMDLLWQDGRILAQGAPGSLDAGEGLRVEGGGRWAAPALADAAVFLSLEGRHPADSVPAGPRQSLERQAAGGVSLLLDLNAHRAFIQDSRGLKGRLPRAVFAGALFTGPGGWRLSGQTPWNSHVVEILEPADLDAPWGRAVRFGDQAAFASVEHEGRDRLGVPLPALLRLGALARSQGLPFIIHVQNPAKALEALQAKPDALLGPLFSAGDGSLAEAMRRQGVLYIPALSSVLNSFPPAPMTQWLLGFPAALTLDPDVLAAATDPKRLAARKRHWQRLGADPAQVLAVPQRLHGAGVKLAFGSGSGQPLVFHGLGAATELDHLARAGFNAAQVLEQSQRSRELLGHGGGRLRRGEDADVLLLQGDPWADPRALASPATVFLDGVGPEE